MSGSGDSWRSLPLPNALSRIQPESSTGRARHQILRLNNMTFLDLYQHRTAVPLHWMDVHRQWASQILETGRAFIPADESGRLPPELETAAAVDLWLPLRRLVVLNNDSQELELVDVDRSGEANSYVLLMWPDGSLYFHVPPRTLEDLAFMYRHARLSLEFNFNRSSATGRSLAAGSVH